VVAGLAVRGRKFWLGARRSLGESLAVREEVEVECLNDIEIAGLLSEP
jgi:hypothetical protein